MPRAIDARLSLLRRSGVDLGECDPGQSEDEGVAQTFVTAEAMQRRTDVGIDPSDPDEEAEDHQVALMASKRSRLGDLGGWQPSEGLPRRLRAHRDGTCAEHRVDVVREVGSR